MPVEVKICGIKSADILEAAIAAGTGYVGFVFFPKSPRYVSPGEAANLARLAKGRAKTVALLVDPDDALVDDVLKSVQPDILQLHGKETPARMLEIARRSGLPVWKAISVESAEDVAAAAAFQSAGAMPLFDAKPPKTLANALPGGNGLTFDWQLLANFEQPFVLSGGLTIETVSDAIRLTGAAIVDVSSGVESSPGQKDPELIREFIRRARQFKAESELL